MRILLQNVVMLSTEHAVTTNEQPGSEAGITELKDKLSDYVNRALYRDEVTYVTKHSKRVAALVPIEIVDAYYEAEQRRADSEAG